MALDINALSSMNSSLEDLVGRLARLSTNLDDEDEIGVELREIERQLQTAQRRLTKAVRRAGG